MSKSTMDLSYSFRTTRTQRSTAESAAQDRSKQDRKRLNEGRRTNPSIMQSKCTYMSLSLMSMPYR
jgi:hypothetical protein